MGYSANKRATRRHTRNYLLEFNMMGMGYEQGMAKAFDPGVKMAGKYLKGMVDHSRSRTLDQELKDYEGHLRTRNIAEGLIGPRRYMPGMGGDMVRFHRGYGRASRTYQRSTRSTRRPWRKRTYKRSYYTKPRRSSYRKFAYYRKNAYRGRRKRRRRFKPRYYL